MKSLICPSMMCADMFFLERDVRTLEACRADLFHIDIMDGEFVPNYTLGTDYIKRLHSFSPICQDIHLMITSPEKKLDRFDIRQGDCVSVHYEAMQDVKYCIEYIKNKGARPILAINPNTDISVTMPYMSDLFGVLIMTVYPGYAGQKLVEGSFEKISAMRTLANENGFDKLRIQVDGNVSFENGAIMKRCGADMFVCGSSSVFSKSFPLASAYEKFALCVK